MADTEATPRPVELIAFAASLRRGSWNRKLLEVAAPIVQDAGAMVEVVDFHDLVFPYFNADDEAAAGIPDAVRAVGARIAAADGLVIASPEYNRSMPGTLKNTIDWISRIRPVPFQGRWALLLSAAPGRVGGNRSLWHLRQPLEAMGTFVYPDMFSLGEATKAFTQQGQLADPALGDRLAKLAQAYVGMVARARA